MSRNFTLDTNLSATKTAFGVENSSFLYLIRLDLEGKYDFVNPCFAKSFHPDAGDFSSHSFHDTIYEQDVAAFQEAFHLCCKQAGQAVTIHLRLYNDQRQIVRTQWDFSCVLNEKHQFLYVSGIGCEAPAVDNESPTSTIEQKVGFIIDNLSDGFYILDRAWKFIHVNKVFEDIVGIPRQRLIGHTIWEVFPNSSGYHYEAAYRKAMLEGESVHFTDFRPDLQRWFSATAHPSSEGLAVYFRDITEQKRIEERIASSESKLRAVLDSTTDSNLLISPHFKVMLFNQVTEKHLQKFYHRKIREGDDIREFLVPGTEDDFYEHFYKALGGETVIVIRKINFVLGESIWFEVKYFPVYNADETLIGVSFNSTNIDLQQRQLDQLKEIAVIHSHGIRQPVANILGIIDLIEKESLNDNNRRWFEMLKRATQQLDTVIHKVVNKASDGEKS